MLRDLLEINYPKKVKKVKPVEISQLLKKFDCSWTKCTIDLEHGSKLKFVHCLETYIRKFISLSHDGMMGPDLQIVQSVSRNFDFLPKSFCKNV